MALRTRMVSLSHWGMFEIELPRWRSAAQNAALGNYIGNAAYRAFSLANSNANLYQGSANAANAFYQNYNFGKLD